MIKSGRRGLAGACWVGVLGWLALAVCQAADLAAQPSFVGKFANNQLSIELVQSGDGYSGTLTIGTGSYPVQVRVAGQQLSGSFAAQGRQYPITGTLEGNHLSLVSGANTYGLDRLGANPPGGIAAAGGAAADGGGPEGLMVLGTTSHGETLFMKLPAGLAANESLKQTAQALAKELDGKPTITRAFTDAKGQAAGGAEFTGTHKGQAVKGVILCGGDAKAGSADVVVAAADASRADTRVLMDFIPQPLKMTTTPFPDGSGSIDLPEGWHTPTQQAANGIVAVGPAGQVVTLGVVQNISDPHCRTIRLSEQTYQTALGMYQRQLATWNQRRVGPPPVAPTPPGDPNDAAMTSNSPLRYCAYCTPDQVVKVYYPLLANLGKRFNQPYTSVDKVMSITPVGATNGAMKMGLGYYAVTDHGAGKEMHLRVVNLILTQDTTPGESWALITSVMRAPDETFDRDLPVMSAIQGSIRLNQGVVGNEFASIGDMVRASGRAAFDTMQKNHAAWQDQQESQFESFEGRMWAQQVARQRSALDMIEFAGGLREVYDTDTGKWAKVDLLNSNDIVDALNGLAGDPDRFVQVPLRDLRPDMW